jgi:hypothetical protein
VRRQRQLSAAAVKLVREVHKRKIGRVAPGVRDRGLFNVGALDQPNRDSDLREGGLRRPEFA